MANPDISQFSPTVQASITSFFDETRNLANTFGVQLIEERTQDQEQLMIEPDLLPTVRRVITNLTDFTEDPQSEGSLLQQLLTNTASETKRGFVLDSRASGLHVVYASLSRNPDSLEGEYNKTTVLPSRTELLVNNVTGSFTVSSDDQHLEIRRRGYSTQKDVLRYPDALYNMGANVHHAITLARARNPR